MGRSLRRAVGSHRGTSYLVVSAIGLGVQLATLVALSRLFHVHYAIATLAGVQAAIVNNFVWHERWTWRDRVDRNRFVLIRLLRFTGATGASSFAGNLVFTSLYVQVLGFPLAVGNLLAVGSTSLINYLALDRFVFRRGLAARLPRSRRTNEESCPLRSRFGLPCRTTAPRV